MVGKKDGMSENDPKDKVEKIFSLMDKVITFFLTIHNSELRMAMGSYQKKNFSKVPNRTRPLSKHYRCTMESFNLFQPNKGLNAAMIIRKVRFVKFLLSKQPHYSHQSIESIEKVYKIVLLEQT